MLDLFYIFTYYYTPIPLPVTSDGMVERLNWNTHTIHEPV